MNRISLLSSIICLLNFGSIFSQSVVTSPPIYQLMYSDEPIDIDGLDSESIWKQTQIAADFILTSPVDNAKPSRNTEVRMVHDHTFLYVLATCFDDDDYIIQTLKRDAFGSSDEFAILIDPVGNKASGYGFGVNAMNAQSEVIISAANTDGSWDNRWYSAVTRHSDHWMVEMKIPLKSIRYKDDITDWRVNFVRIDPGSNEQSVWSPVPRQFDFQDIGFYGTMRWDVAPKKASGNISLIPYTSLRYDKTATESKGKLQAGGDAKIALSSSLNLDLTSFSDFSQVEVDVQVTNLTRFNIFFPERRQFFIENNDIFNNFGQGADQAFYSRRIGLDPSGQPIPILYGARLTGNVSESLRIGTFNMQTQNISNQGADNFSAFAFQQRVFTRSQVRGIFLNRQGWKDGGFSSSDYGRNAGGDFLYTSDDGKIVTSMGYIHSFKN
ncbi:MAG: DUF5916 domain-containing protein, partial [Saprospiraceae bacterium]